MIEMCISSEYWMCNLRPFSIKETLPKFWYECEKKTHHVSLFL